MPVRHIILCLVNHDLFDLQSKRPVALQVIFVVHIHQSCPWTSDALSSGIYYTIISLMTAVIFLWLILSLPLLLTCVLPSFLTTGYRHVYLEGLTEASIFVHVSVHDVYGKVSVKVLSISKVPVFIVAFPQWASLVKWDYILDINIKNLILSIHQSI